MAVLFDLSCDLGVSVVFVLCLLVGLVSFMVPLRSCFVSASVMSSRVSYGRSNHCNAKSKLFQFPGSGIGRGAMKDRIESRGSRVSGPLPSPLHNPKELIFPEHSRFILGVHLIRLFHLLLPHTASFFTCMHVLDKECMLMFLFSFLGICKGQTRPDQPLHHSTILPILPARRI